MIEIDQKRVSRGASCRKHGDPAWTIPMLDGRLPCPECWHKLEGTDEILLPEFPMSALYTRWASALWIAVCVVVKGPDGTVWAPWAWERQN